VEGLLAGENRCIRGKTCPSATNCTTNWPWVCVRSQHGPLLWKIGIQLPELWYHMLHLMKRITATILQ